MNNQAHKEQRFIHLATYRLDDLQAAETSGNAELGPDVFEDEITTALANTLTARLTNVCEEHEWQVIDISAFHDRIEAFITGMEPDGQNGEAVATALDGVVYIGISPCAEAVLN